MDSPPTPTQPHDMLASPRDATTRVLFRDPQCCGHPRPKSHANHDILQDPPNGRTAVHPQHAPNYEAGLPIHCDGTKLRTFTATRPPMYPTRRPQRSTCHADSLQLLIVWGRTNIGGASISSLGCEAPHSTPHTTMIAIPRAHLRGKGGGFKGRSALRFATTLHSPPTYGRMNSCILGSPDTSASNAAIPHATTNEGMRLIADECMQSRRIDRSW